LRIIITNMITELFDQLSANFRWKTCHLSDLVIQYPEKDSFLKIRSIHRVLKYSRSHRLDKPCTRIIFATEKDFVYFALWITVRNMFLWYTTDKNK